ncbi:nuclear transport factor 2 family protein [Nocardioides sp. WS12]|uniref:ester cyclase n=1 Tax=Nocardioides sp. WS12 TaxID=2486272 RepID=UPI0015FD22B5|nr:nuclear transport factor 2 family protein [Nocardioides sp. WS12]
MTTSKTAPSSTLEQNRAVASEFFTAVHERDIDRMQAVWKPGSIDAFPGFRTMTVPDEQRGFFLAFFDAFHDWKVEVLDITCEGDVAAVHWRLTAGFTGPGLFDGFTHTGAKGTVQGFDRLVIQDGKIVHLDAYLDTTEMARVIGLMPPAGSGMDKGMKKMVNAQTRIKRALKRS